MGVVNVEASELRVQMDRQARVAIAFRRDKKRVDYIGFDGNGPQHLFETVTIFDRQFNRESFNPLEDSVLSFLRSLKRAYLPGEDVAGILLEILHMTNLNGKALTECTVKELVAHYNKLHKLAGNSGGITEKTFKTKGLLIEACSAMEASTKGRTPEQTVNKQDMQTATTKRLAGLDKQKEEKAQQKEDKKAVAEKKTAKTSAKKEKLPFKPDSIKKAEKPAAPAKKGAEPKAKKEVPEKKGRGQGIGAHCMELILAGKTNEEVVTAAKKKFPESNTSASPVAWYRNKLKSEGKLK